jgi:SAM-dependent methyltransferase
VKEVDNALQCDGCQKVYQVEAGIPLLFCPHDLDRSQKGEITSSVKSFYEETPFPNYDGFEDIGDLVQRARQSVFAHLLNEQIPFNVRILEAGCGTGQLSNFLGIAQRDVIGTDFCHNSLKLAHAFKTKHDLSRANFYQMNLFKPAFHEESFHLVICNGVLHHTNAPYDGFRSIAKLVKKGGYIIIGLYNRYGRLLTDIRRPIFKLFGSRVEWLDPFQRKKKKGEAKKEAWFKDQYLHPCESTHTIGELLQWFDETGFEFVSGIPNPKAFMAFDRNEKIFNPHPRGNKLDHLIVQAQMIVSGGREGGLFIMVGKKKNYD